jgi:dephospho-CoA kinase
MFLFIGLTGPLGSGKGTVAEILSALASEHGIKVICYSLSDEIRKELERKGIQAERDALRETANIFRSRRGNGVWASLVASRIADRLAVMEDEASEILVIIDAIRNPGEVYELRERFGDRFKLLGVTAPLEIIRENLQRRRRNDESERMLEDVRELQKVIEIEMGAGEPGFGHNVAACMKMTDWPSIHNDGSLAELEGKVRALADQHIFPLFAVD